MNEHAVAIFCICDEVTKTVGFTNNSQRELTEGSILFSDRAYTDYALADDLKQIAQLQLVTKRKVSHKRQHSQSLVFLLNSKRNLIETVFSSITSRMPRFIRARTEKGFYLKVLFFIIAYLIHRLSKHSRL